MEILTALLFLLGSVQQILGALPSSGSTSVLNSINRVVHSSINGGDSSGVFPTALCENPETEGYNSGNCMAKIGGEYEYFEFKPFDFDSRIDVDSTTVIVANKLSPGNVEYYNALSDFVSGNVNFGAAVRGNFRFCPSGYYQDTFTESEIQDIEARVAGEIEGYPYKNALSFNLNNKLVFDVCISTLPIDTDQTQSGLCRFYTKCIQKLEGSYFESLGDRSCKGPDGSCTTDIQTNSPDLYEFPTNYCTTDSPITYCLYLMDFRDENQDECLRGSYCPRKVPGVPENEAHFTDASYLCPAGTYCPNRGQFAPLNCPVGGFYCPEGTSVIFVCTPGYYCPDPSELRLCPEGYYCTGGERFQCAPDSFCPIGSREEGTDSPCDNIGTRFVNETTGACTCYDGWEGIKCERLTLMGKNDTFEPRVNVVIERGRECNNFDEFEATAPDCTQNTERPLPDSQICPDPFWPLVAVNDAARLGVQGCCREFQGLIPSSATDEQVYLEYICSGVGVSTSDYEPTALFTGVSLQTQTASYHYCCHRYKPDTSETAIHEFQDFTLLWEDLFGSHYLPIGLESESGEEESIEAAETVETLLQKHFLGGLSAFQARDYYKSYTSLSYIYLLNMNLESRLESTETDVPDYENIMSRTVQWLRSKLDVSQELVGYNGATNETDYNFAPEFAAMVVRLEHFLLLGNLMTDTFAYFLRPQSTDTSAFLENTGNYIESASSVMAACRFTGDREASVEVPSCGSSLSSVEAQIEVLAAGARCALVPKTENLVGFASNLLPSVTYLSNAFYCLRQIPKSVANIDQYESTLVYLMEIVDTVRFIYNGEQDPDILAVTALINEEFKQILAFRNRDAASVSTVRDNTLGFYENSASAQKERLQAYIAGISIQSLGDNITDAIDAQTTDLVAEIQTGNYELFQFLNQSFTTTFNAFYGGIDLEEANLNLTIQQTNSSLRQSLSRIALDTEIMKEYVEIFATRMETIQDTAGDRITYLYEIERARADLALAKAQINFVVGMLLDILTLPLMFLGPIGVAADLAASGVQIGLSAALSSRRLDEMVASVEAARRELTVTVENLEDLSLSLQFNYSESTVELFADFSEDSRGIIQDGFVQCNSTFVGENSVSKCLSTFNDLLYGVLELSLERDYAHGCTEQAYSGFQSSDRIVRDLDTYYHSFSQQLIGIFRTDALAKPFWDRIITEVKANWECVDDYQFTTIPGFSSSNSSARRLQNTPLDGLGIQSDITMKKTSLIKVLSKLNELGSDINFGTVADSLDKTQKTLRRDLYRLVTYRSAEAYQNAKQLANLDLWKNLMLKDLDDFIRVGTPSEFEKLALHRLVADLPDEVPEDVLFQRKLRFNLLQDKIQGLRRFASAEYTNMRAILLASPEVAGEILQKSDSPIRASVSALTRAGQRLNSVYETTKSWSRTVARQLPGRGRVAAVAGELGDFLVDRGIRGAASARASIDAIFESGSSAAKGFSSGGKTASKILKAGSRGLQLAGPGFNLLGLVLGPIEMNAAKREHQRAVVEAEAAKDSRYSILGQVMTEISYLFEEIVLDLEKLVLQATLASVEVGCEELLTDTQCQAIDAGSANQWDDVAFKMIDFIEVQTGLCPVTSDYDLFEQDGFRRRQLALTEEETAREIVRNERFLGAIADKRDAEERINQNQALYDEATERMHTKECPEFISIIHQITSYGKAIHSDIIAATEQGRKLRSLSKQREATTKRKIGMSQSFDGNAAFNQAFIEAKKNQIESTYLDSDIQETAKSIARTALQVNAKLEHLADVNEQNQFFRETCELIEYLKPEVPETLGQCSVPRIDTVQDTVFGGLLQLRDEMLDTEEQIQNLFESGIYGSSSYNTAEEFLIDITHKIDFSSDDWVQHGRFTFELLPPPKAAYSFLQTDENDTDTYASPWFAGATSMLLYDVQFVYFDGQSPGTYIYPEGSSSGRQVISDFTMGPKFTKTWVEPSSEIGGTSERRQQEYVFAFRDDANIEGGIIKLQSRYFHNGDPSDTKFSDNLVNDATSDNTPDTPLPSPYTSYTVQVDSASKDAIRTLISQRDNAADAVSVGMIVSYYFSPESTIQGPFRETEPPTPPTPSPTLSPDSVAFGGYRDPTETLVFCDQSWTYRKASGQTLVDVTATQADNCLPIDDPDTQPFNPSSTDHNFPALSDLVQDNIPPGYELDTSRWCSIRQTLCQGSSSLYRPDATTPDGICTTNAEVRQAWGFCMKPQSQTSTPSSSPTPSAPSVPSTPPSLPPTGDETFAVGAFRDPSSTTIVECDATWSYRQQGGVEFPEIFPDAADNCLSVSDPLTQPFFKQNGPPDVDYAPEDPDVLAEVPAGYEILPDRWCSIKQNPDVCGSSNTLYRPDASTTQGSCTEGLVRRGWAYCVRAITVGPTPSPIEPTPSPTVFVPEGRSGIGGFYSTSQLCDTSWTYQNSDGSQASPDEDNCMSTEDFPPRQVEDPDFLPSSSIVAENLPAGKFVSGTRWCSVAQNACNKVNANYNRDVQSDSNVCSTYQMRRAWVFCTFNVTGNETPFPTPEPTPQPTRDYPLAIGGYVDPSGGPVTCDNDATYRSILTDLKVDADADGTFPLDPALGRYPFIVDTQEEFFDPEETVALAEGLPPNTYISKQKWCSIKSTVCNNPNSNGYIREVEDDGSSSGCTAPAGQQRRAWGYAVLPGVNPETDTPTTAPVPSVATLAPTTTNQRYPRAIQGFTGSNGIGLPCDQDWFFRETSGGTLIPADIDGCLSLEDPATQPFRWTQPDFQPVETAVGVIAGVTEVDYTRWCSVKQTLYNTGNNFYTNQTTAVSGSASGPGELMRAWGYCLKTVSTEAPTQYPTSFPTVPSVPTTRDPTREPTRLPTRQPTNQPSRQPTVNAPTTKAPTGQPTIDTYDIAIYSAAGAIGLILVSCGLFYFTSATSGVVAVAERFNPVASTDDLGIDPESRERIFRSVVDKFVR